MKRALTLGIISSVLSLSALAHAAEPAFTLEKPQVAVNLAYGVYTGDDMGGDFNPYGLGFGVRGGYTLPASVYLGGSFEYFLGYSEDVAGGEFSANIYQIMFEGGYDVGLGATAVLRPMLGLGYATVNAESCFDPGFGLGETCADGGSSEFAIAPGAMALVDFGGVFGLATARYNHIFADGNASAILLGVGAGMTF